MPFKIKKAERTKVKLKLAIEGPSGSGKTYSSLLIASGLVPGGKILLLDTENSSASLFSDLCEFYTIDFNPPYTPERYREAVRMAVSEKFDVLIIDSGSHEWNGTGGCLEIHDGMPGNPWANWAKVTPRHDAFVASMLQAPIHIIMTLRSKEKYIQEDINGKQKIKKMGAEAIQRDGLSYEFSVVLTMDISHQATSTKDRTGLFPVDQWFVPSQETGRQIADWLESGVDVSNLPSEPTTAKEAPQNENRSQYTPQKENGAGGRKKAIYEGYLEICGEPTHTKNAIMLVTSGRSSKDWTEEDMANLELDLKRRKEEAQRKASWDYKAPESVRDADPGIDDEAYAAEMGIGPDTEGKPKMKPFSEVEKLIADIKSVFGPDALGFTDKEREAWIKENFEGKNLTQLTKDERKQVLAMARKMLKARDEAELKGVA